MPDLNPLQPGRALGGGRFMLIRMLGRGGMGEVWLARDQRLGEQTALKFLPAEYREKFDWLEYLRLEVARSHRLTHPNIVRLHDLYEPPGEPAFFSMEYIDGMSLHACRHERKNKVLPWEFLRKPLAQLCSALEYAHEENFVHRDLKPDNLLLDSRGRLKLTDLGVATTTSDLARYGGMRGGGTMHYMSPQQVEGKHPQVTDDMYALGATIYELLTSQRPFHAEEVRDRVLYEPAEPMAQRLATLEIENEIPHDVEALVMNCLAKDPAERPPGAKVVAFLLNLGKD